MQTAAQIEMTPAITRKCRGHNGNHFVPASDGEGHWVYYWLSLPQAWFWRTRSESEKAVLIRSGKTKCFVCSVQHALEQETLVGIGR